jgi:hypothetical protein
MLAGKVFPANRTNDEWNVVALLNHDRNDFPDPTAVPALDGDLKLCLDPRTLQTSIRHDKD